LFKKLHFQIEHLVSFLKRNYLFLIFGITAGSLFFLSKDKILPLIQTPLFYPPSIGIEGRYHQNSLPQEITQLITFGLIQNNPNNKTAASPLVKSIDIENDNKDYIFHLHSDYNWHNGKKFTSSDVNYQIPGLNIETIDKYTLKISSEKTFAPLLSLLKKPLFNKDLVGLGQYQVKKIQYQYNYINSLTLQNPKQKNDSLVYRFYPNQTDLITAFKLGEIDQIQTSYLPNEFSSPKNIKITQTVQVDNQYSAIFLNTQKFNNKQFRQSLAYATPKSTDKNERCLGPISPNSWAYNNSVKQYNFSPSRAQQLMKDSGEKIDSINLAVNNRKLLATAEQIKQSWSENLGINVIITIENQIDKQNFDAVLAFGTIPHDPDQYYFWHSTQSNTNLTNFQDERIDKLLEEGRQLFDHQERKNIYQDFQKYLLEESPAIFLSYPTLYTISRIK